MILRTSIVCFVALVSGCGQVPDETLWRSPEYGVAMLDAPGADWLSPTTLDGLVNHFTIPALEQSTGWRDLDLRRCAARVQIWTDAEGHDDQQLGDVLRVAPDSCPWDGTLRHQLAHQLQRCLDGFNDVNHTEESVWSVVTQPRDPAIQDCLGDVPTQQPPLCKPGSSSVACTPW